MRGSAHAARRDARRRAGLIGSPLAAAFTQGRFRLVGTHGGQQDWRCLGCDRLIVVTQPPGTPFARWWRVLTDTHPICPGQEASVIS